MTFKDLLKTSALESLSADVDIRSILIILLLACCAGTYIYFVYRGFSKSAFYSRDLNITIAGVCVVVAAIMVAMQSSLLVSLGMIGALSIVRFRTALKNPLDLLYMFWSISCGIIIGVNLYGLAAIACAVMTFIIWLLGEVPHVRAPFLLVVRAKIGSDRESINSTVKRNSTYMHMASMRVYGNDMELIYEVKSKDISALVSAVSGIDDVNGVNCIEHDGELRA